MDDTRIQRRTRAKSYDLRRKVLLKNFLRDQMTHIPETSTESFPSPGNSEESSIEVNEEASPITLIYADAYNIPNSSEVDDENNMKSSRDEDIDLTEDIDVETVDNFDIPAKYKPTAHSLKLFKFKGLLKRRRYERHERELDKASKKAFKAKKFGKNAKSPVKTRSFKKSFEKVFYGHKKHHESPSHATKSSSRSLFSLFKHRREQRHANNNDRTRRSSSDNHIPKNHTTRSSSVNQSVQTDDSLVKYEMNKVHESNMRLKEENKLLSESLSYFMSNETTPYQSPYKNENSLMFHDYTLPPSNSSQAAWNSRSKVSRSNSFHEFNERHKVLRNNYRTKSMNVHNSRNYFLTSSRPLLPSYTDEVNTPRLRKRPILTNIPNSSSNRTIQRRSSMPERTHPENNRWVSHGRSNSMRYTHTRKPFYALSADAFY